MAVFLLVTGLDEGGALVRFRLLGPVEVEASGQLFELGDLRRRAVLAVLLHSAGRVVATETLIDQVWGEAVPAKVRTTLQVYVSRIRNTLAQAAAAGGEPAPLMRHSGGYRLDIDSDRVDLHRFRRLVVDSRDHERSLPQRAALLRQAVALWTGEPLTGIGGTWAERCRDSWRQEHLDAIAAWATAELQTGNPAVALAPLGEFAEAHPEFEPLTVALMRSLAAMGRPTDALLVGDRHRRRLAEEFGTDQAPEVRHLYEAIVRGDLPEPVPAATIATVTPVPEYCMPVPAQLPGDVPTFVGRGEHLAALDALLPDEHAGVSAAVVISSVSGTAGIGKTALAVHWANRVRGRFVDGQLYVNLRGFGPADAVTAPNEAVCGFLDALGVPPQRIPSTLDAQVGLYRSLVAGKRILVVLDNVRDADQVRPLLPATGTAMAIITSRNRLTALTATDGVHPMPLDLLSRAEASALLSRRLGADRVTANRHATEQIISACAGLPLALAIVAARAQHTGFALAALAAELRQARNRLDALDAGDPSTEIRAVFSWSYTALTPAAARVFRLLGLHPGPDISAEAAARLVDQPAGRVRRTLAELVHTNLLTEHSPGRYAFHDLLRAYAAELAHTLDTASEREVACDRLIEHYLKWAELHPMQ